MYKINDKVRVLNNNPLPGNKVAPPIETGKEYTIQEICLDSKGNQHLDLGLVSQYNYITSYETKEELPHGDQIHWVHPSRVELV